MLAFQIKMLTVMQLEAQLEEELLRNTYCFRITG
jgi:hypothetical protein